MKDSWALITGPTAGIGLELAALFAAEGWNLVLVARNQSRLQELADQWRRAYGIEVLVLARDLAQPGVAAEIFQGVGTRPVGVLVNNAGFGGYGEFIRQDLAKQTDMMQVNMVALVQLTHLFLPQMLARRAGRILNVASTAAFQPGPTMNVYYATKAFVYSFSYALAQELQGSGVTVTALCPGMTRTDFQARAHLHMKSDWLMMDARTVARAGYRGLMKGKAVVIPGLVNKVAAFFAKRLPPGLTSAVVRRVHGKG